MGQYYLIVNIDKNEVMQPFDFGNGLKLMEWSYCKNYMVLALLDLLSDEWKGDRVYVIGDYADADDMSEPWAEIFAKLPFDIYHNADDWMHLVPYDHSICEFRKDFNNTKDVFTDDFEYRYIYNHETKEFIDLEHCPLEWVWFDTNGDAEVSRIFPLSLLLAMGNGRGGGDYRGENKDLCGSWCKYIESIEVSQFTLDVNYTEFCPDFTERSELVPYTDIDKFIEGERAKRIK